MSAAEQVPRVRSFNRTVGQAVGALDDRFLGRRRPMNEARVLWEIGTEGCELRSLRSRLGLDSGHLSRLLRALEEDGLVLVAASEHDRRARVARLTAAGLRERSQLDRWSDALAESMLARLDPASRAELVEAMSRVQRLLLGPLVEIGEADPRSADARRCVRAYFDELDRRSETGFDPAAGISAEPHELVPPSGAFLLARLRGEPVGCGAVKHHAGAPSEIKRMWIAEPARGLGLGGRMLEELELCARAAGAPAARLETNRALVEAIALYRSSGYAEVAPFNDEPFADHWFEKRL